MWGLVPVSGAFREIEGEATSSPAGDVTGHHALRTASLDTKISNRDKHLRSDDFFASDKYPAITFTADKIEPAGQGVTVSGTLTVRDQSRPISFPADPSQAGDSEVTLDATVRVDRSDFGLTFNQMMNAFSMQNTVTVHAVFTRADPGEGTASL
jgi:polyisoprenoid-binding protein YceI